MPVLGDAAVFGKADQSSGITALCTWPAGRGVVCLGVRGGCIGTAIEMCPMAAAKQQHIKI